MDIVFCSKAYCFNIFAGRVIESTRSLSRCNLGNIAMETKERGVSSIKMMDCCYFAFTLE